LTCKGKKRFWAWFDPFPAIMLRGIPKKLTVPYGSWYKQFTTTVMEECEEKSPLCPMGHHTNSPQQQSQGAF